MKYIKFVTLFVCVLAINAMALPPNWKLTQEVEGIKVWQYLTNTDVTGTFEKRKLESRIDWSKTDEKEFVKNFSKKKEFMLSLINIKNWKTTKVKWTAQKRFHHFFAEGSYLDSNQQEILFVEEHFYYPDETIQLLHTRPKSQANGEKIALEILSILKKEAGLLDE